jgi:hypothetical protein
MFGRLDRRHITRLEVALGWRWRAAPRRVLLTEEGRAAAASVVAIRRAIVLEHDAVAVDQRLGVAHAGLRTAEAAITPSDFLLADGRDGAGVNAQPLRQIGDGELVRAQPLAQRIPIDMSCSRCTRSGIGG